jgi:ammonium transporter, Amt family
MDESSAGVSPAGHLAASLGSGRESASTNCGAAGPIGSLALGFIVSPICPFFVSKVKNALKYDEALDVRGAQICE